MFCFGNSKASFQSTSGSSEVLSVSCSNKNFHGRLQHGGISPSSDKSNTLRASTSLFGPSNKSGAGVNATGRDKLLRTKAVTTYPRGTCFKSMPDKEIWFFSAAAADYAKIDNSSVLLCLRSTMDGTTALF